jgi:hypothetical protein
MHAATITGSERIGHRTSGGVAIPISSRIVIIEAKLAATTEACRCAGSEGRGPSGGRSSLRASGAHQATRARARVFAILKDRRAGDESSAITVNPLHQPSTAGGQIVNHLRLMQPQPIEVDQIDVRSETRCEAAAIGKAEEIGGLDGRDSPASKTARATCCKARSSRRSRTAGAPASYRLRAILAATPDGDGAWNNLAGNQGQRRGRSTSNGPGPSSASAKRPLCSARMKRATSRPITRFGKETVDV